MKWQAVRNVPSEPDGDYLWFEDGGDHMRCYPFVVRGQIIDINDPSDVGGDDAFAIQLRSDQSGADRADESAHRTMRAFMGRRIRITIETID